jgi:hypothetical protein
MDINQVLEGTYAAGTPPSPPRPMLLFAFCLPKGFSSADAPVQMPVFVTAQSSSFNRLPTLTL